MGLLCVFVSQKSCFICRLGMADGSKYYSTHEIPLVAEAGSGSGMRAVASIKCFVFEFVKQSCHHIAEFMQNSPKIQKQMDLSSRLYR